MAKFQPGTGTIVVEGVKTPENDTDAANKAYVDANSGSDDITASGGLQRVNDDISIADDGVTTAKINDDAVTSAKVADNAVTSGAISDNAVITSKIANEAVNELKLDATNTPSTGQVLSAASSNQFTWVDAADDETITASGGLARTGDDIAIVDSGINEVKLNVTNTPTAGQVLSSATDTTQFTWVNQSSGGTDDITASGGLQRVGDDISIVDSGVTTAKINADAVTNAKIADDAVDADQIASSAVTTDKINDSAVTAGKIASDAVTEAKISSSAVTVGKIASNAVNELKLDATNTPSTGQILSASGSNDQFTWVDASTDEAITASGGLNRTGNDISITDGGVNEVKLNVTNTPTAGQVLSSATDTTQFTWVDQAGDTVITASGGLQRVGDDISIEDSGVTTDKIADDAISSAKIATSAVGSDAIAQHAVTTFEIAPDAVDEIRLDATNTPTAGQILSATGTNNQFTWIDDGEEEAITASGGLQRVGDDISIVDGGVTTAKIASQAITTDKIADGAIVSSDIAEGAVISSRIADGAISNAKLASEAVKEVNLDITNTPTAGQVLTSASDTTQFTWADQAGGDSITASGGLQRIGDDISIATGGVDTTQLAAGAVDTNRLEDDAVSEAKIADLAVKERHLDITNDPTAGQVLTSATDTTQFTWADQSSTLTAGEFIDITSEVISVDDVYDPVNDETFTKSASADTIPSGQFFWSENSGLLTLNPTNPESNDDINAAVRSGMTFRMIKTNSLGTVQTAYYAIRFSSPELSFYNLNLIPDSDVDNDNFFDDPALGSDTFKFTVLQLQAGGSFGEARVGWLKDVDDTDPNTGEALVWNGGQSQWGPTETVNAITNGGHIVPGTNSNGSVSLTFDETFDLWNGKSDWVQINTGTPSGDNILWDATTETLSVPSLGLDGDDNARTVLSILLNARSGMAVQIRQENTTSDPSGFQSGFYQILSIDAVDTPSDLVTLRLLPDASDIFTEDAGNTYQYELSILQFVTGGTLDNLTLEGLADTNFTTAPIASNVLGFNSNGQWVPVAATQADISGNVIGDLANVSATVATEGQILSWVVAEGGGTSEWTPMDNSGGGAESLNELTDVTITSVADDQILQYNSTTSQFENVALPAAEAPDLGDLGDVNTNGVADGFIIRYDSDNSNYRAHSVGDTNRLYGGIDVDMPSDFVVPDGSGTSAVAIGDGAEATATYAVSIGQDSESSGTFSTAVGRDTVASSSNAVAIGSEADAGAISAVAVGDSSDASGANSIALGSDSQASFASSSALGDSANAAHTNSTAIGTGATTQEIDEVRLGDGNAHVTVPSSVAGNESQDNQLVSKRWVNNQISDASRVISSTANALENLTIVTESTPWDDYRIVPVDTLNDPSLEVHMYEFDATQPQFIFYAGFLSSSSFGTGAGLTTGTIPDFFEEVTDIANEAEVTNADGEAVTSLGWKYLGHDLATVWQAVSHVYTFNFDWIYPAGNSDGTQNPPDVTSSLELVRLKPTGVDTYNMASNVTIIASSPTSFHNAGSLQPGNTETFTGSYEFAQQTLEDGISNVENGDVFAYRMKIRYKGNGFDGETNVRLAITESETTNFVPQLGIRHVGRDYSFVLEDSGDLQWTDHGSVDQSTLLLLENTADGPEIPAATLGIVGGEGISITGKTINVNLQNLNSGLEFDSVNDLRVDAGDGLQLDSTGVALDFRTETNNPLEVSGTGDAAGLSLNIDEDGPLSKTTNGLDVTIETNGGLAIGSLNSGIEVLLPANSGLQTTSTGLSLNAGIDELTDVALQTGDNAPTDGQVLTYDGTNWQNEDASGGAEALGDLSDVTLGTLADGQILSYNGTNWLNTTLSGNHSFTAGTGLSFNTDGTVLNTDGNSIEYTSFGVDSGDAVPTLNAGTTRQIILGGNGIVGGASAIAIGTSTQALATSSIAIGLSARADAATSTALGGGARAFLTDATAIGRSASANGAQSTAVGSNASTSATDATALGTDSNAVGVRSISIGQASTASGTNTVSVGNAAVSASINGVFIGSSATGSGARSVGIGSGATTGSNALGVAVGERARVGAVRGIAIGSSSNSADSNADLCRADGANSIAIGKAARADATGGIAIGDETQALTTSTTAIGDGATVALAATGSTAIGNAASATLPNTTVLGTGSTHRVFAGTRELSAANSVTSDTIAFTVSSTAFQGGFEPTATLAEELNYVVNGDSVVGRMSFRLSTATTTNFSFADRWFMTSTSQDVIDCFGFSSPTTVRIPLGIISVIGPSSTAGATGMAYIHGNTSNTQVAIGCKMIDTWGNGAGYNDVLTLSFNLAKIV